MIPDSEHIDPSAQHVQVTLVPVPDPSKPRLAPVLTVAKLALPSGGVREGSGRASDLAARTDLAVKTDAVLTLPSMGMFDIVATYVDDCGTKANVTKRVGMTEEQWYAKPLTALPFGNVKADKDEYDMGESVLLQWSNPLPSMQALVIWGNDGAVPRKRKLFTLKQGQNSMSIGPLADECTGGCDAQVAILSPTDESFSLPVSLPLSKQMDLALPQLVPPQTVTLKIAAPKKPLALSIAAPEHMLPDSEAEVKLRLLDSAGKPMVGAELALWVVDKALVDLLPVSCCTAAAHAESGEDSTQTVQDILI